jgi:hypothetical protein
MVRPADARGNRIDSKADVLGPDMASAGDFRRIALSFEGAEERAHMGHPDFRVGGKIFATLGAPEDFIVIAPAAFRPAAGAWGRAGSTMVLLEAASEDVLENALAAAWRRRAGKP